jgi:NTP pyrophosphatase (non-canonical NTP hydrolase)
MKKQLTFEEVSAAVLKHVAERHRDDNTPRGLAISISLEANELLEHYQWQEKSVGSKEDLEGEVADILIYLIQFARVYDIDIPEAITKKLEKSAKKYPLEKFSSVNAAEREAAWIEVKKISADLEADESDGIISHDVNPVGSL